MSLRPGVLSVVAAVPAAVPAAERPAELAGLPVQWIDAGGGGSLAERLNAGAAQADGQFLLLLPGAPELPWDGLPELLRALERDPSLGAVAPATPEQRAAGRDVLSAPTGRLLLRTAAWRAAGGLEPSLDGVLDDVDLGWRLNLLGYRVQRRGELVLPPAARGGTARQLAAGRLAVAFRCLDDASVAGLLGAALGGALAGGPAGEPAGGAPGEAAEGVRDFLDRLPALAGGRSHVQATRVADERQLLPLVADSDLQLPLHPGVLAATGQAEPWSGRRRVLVVTGDTLGERMAGPAIRAWEMAHALAAEHEVVLAALGGCTISAAGFEAASVDTDRLRALVDWCEVLVFQGFLLRDHPWLVDSDKVLVADVYDPIHLEVLEQERHRPLAARQAASRDSIETINTQMRRADFLLCASSKQRDLWLGHLASVGRINPLSYDGDENLERLIAVVPFGIPAAAPVHRRDVIKGVVPGIGPQDKVILWGGGIYNWFDPLTLIHAVDRVRAERPDVRLYFLGTKHPNPQVPAMRMAAGARELAGRLGLTDRFVFFNSDWVPYADRQNYLLEADIGVSCHYQHVETAFSFRTRILDYLWAGLPIVTTAGDAFGDLVAGRELGAAVPPEDVGALAEALLRLLDDPDLARNCAKNVAEVAPGFTWDTALAPLVRFCRAPARARDLTPDRWPDAAAGLPGPPRTARSELALARQYLRQGGAGELVRRVLGRLRRIARRGR